MKVIRERKDGCINDVNRVLMCVILKGQNVKNLKKTAFEPTNLQ